MLKVEFTPEALANSRGKRRLFLVATIASIVIAGLVGLLPPIGYALFTHSKMTTQVMGEIKWLDAELKPALQAAQTDCKRLPGALDTVWPLADQELQGNYLIAIDSPCGRMTHGELSDDLGVTLSSHRVVDGAQLEITRHRPFGNALETLITIAILSLWLGFWSYMFVRHIPLQAMLEALSELELAKEENVQFRIAKEAAESNARLRAMFLTNVTHELRTPMNGIIGMMDLIGDTPLDEEQAEYLAIAQRSIGDLNTIVNDILDFSKIESSGLEIHNVDFQCNELLGSLVETYRRAAEKKGLTFKHKTNLSTVSELINTDPVRIRQIASHLLANAVKFTLRGEIVLETLITDAAGQPQLGITITDSGIGIAEEEWGNIFKPFFQIDDSTTRHFGGTGLGLTIVSKVVEEVKGTLSFESRLGQGSTFRVQIPVVLKPLAGATRLSPEIAAVS